MTNHWIDIANSDCVLIAGCNPAENHPIGFGWVTKAMEKGAKLIVVDPRFTRSASKADLHMRLRPGTDITLFNGLCSHVIRNELYQREYLVNYTNAGFIVKPGFSFENGVFSGFDSEKRSYDYGSWDYETDSNGKPLVDPSLNDPRCVFQSMKRFLSRYTPKTVEAVTGIPRKHFDEMAEMYSATGQPGKSGTILYAMGATQHSTGVQIIRSYSILQLLLGNMGVAGGGINALRGANNVQGSTDLALLFNALPGYLSIPSEAAHPTLKDYLDKETPKASFWSNKPKFFVSMLKAFWGESAQRENDFAYDYMPKVGKGFQGAGYSWIPLFEAMNAGAIKGMMVWGMNPAISSPSGNHTLSALEKLDWMAAFDLWETDTSVFWKRPLASAKDVKTEVFLFPAADALEKEGSVTNSGRWIQWRAQAVKPNGDAKSDLWYLNRLALELKRLYAEDPKSVCPGPIVRLNWEYGNQDPEPHLVAREINGYTTSDRKQVANFLGLKDDGSTAGGCWIYSGFYPGANAGDNKAASRDPADPSGLGLHPGWAYAWPVNRRIVYNRCSADAKGQPWNAAKALVRWDDGSKTWVRNDVPDFKWVDPASKVHFPPEESANTAFIMLPEGKSRLFVPKGACKEGPFPEHYEPVEGLFTNILSAQRSNPMVKIWKSKLAEFAQPADPKFPLIGTTFRVTEHWQTGAMTRNLACQAELVPEMFVEISPGLAKARRIKTGDWVKVVSARGEVPARTLVTARIGPFHWGPPDSATNVEIVALPWHFGFAGLTTGGPDAGQNYSANSLTPLVGDANTMIPEYKVFLCDIQKA